MQWFYNDYEGRDDYPIVEDRYIGNDRNFDRDYGRGNYS